VVALTIVAIAVVISDWRDYYSYAPRLFRAGIIPTLLIVTFVMASLHELAHGLTCKYFGGHVQEMGFLVLYFMPGFYCGVSDAWLFNDKSKRMWVSFAGMFFQMFVGALAAIAWRLIGHGTLLGDVCYITMAVSALTILFNLNPLIKLDGYYLLSDYLDVPNLRRVAFAYLLSRIWGRRYSNLGGRAEIPRREKLIYVSYSMLAGAFSVGLVVLFFWKVIGLVLSHSHAGAFLFYKR
jgi:putative peptide zinc metalloprotease protein